MPRQQKHRINVDRTSTPQFHVGSINNRCHFEGSYYLDMRYGCDKTLQRRHIECDGVSNYWRLDCLLNRLIRRRSKKTSKLRVTGLCVCVGGGGGGGEFTGDWWIPRKRASNAENVSIWWRHHAQPPPAENYIYTPLSSIDHSLAICP